jgi:hypothetical protein
MYKSACPELQVLPPSSVFVFHDGVTTDGETIAGQVDAYVCPVTGQNIAFQNFIRDLSHTKQTYVTFRKEDGYEHWLRLEHWVTGLRPTPVTLRSTDIVTVIEEAGFTFVDAKVSQTNPRQAIVTYIDNGVQKHTRFPMHGTDITRRRKNTFRKRR